MSEETKTVELPSGMSAVIKKLDTRGYKKVYRVTTNADDTEIADRLMCEVVVEPQLVALKEGEANPDGALDVNDLPLDDYLVLSLECQSFTGLGEVLERVNPLLERMRTQQGSTS
jgi:hypothetical protein